MTYIVDWQSGGNEGIPRKNSINLPEKTKDSISTSITLTGLGVSKWGEIQQENFIRLMENFASATPPANPTIGQLWYNPAENVLYMNVDDLTVTDIPLYHPQSPARWAQVWPSSGGLSAYAYIDEYNALAIEINRIIGTPSTLGVDSDVARNQWGWGQNDLVPVYDSVKQLSTGFDPTIYPPVFDNSAWVILLSRLRKALRQIGQPETLGSNVGFINDRRPFPPGNGLANSYNNFPAQGTLPNIGAGWKGAGLVTIQNDYNRTITAIDILKMNRFALAPLSSQINQLASSTRTTPWTQTITHSMSFTFPNQNTAKAFFNAGGSLKFEWSHVGGVDLLNMGWTNFLAEQTGLQMNYKGTHRNYVYEMSTAGGTDTIGFYDLTSTFQTIYQRNRRNAGYYETVGDGKLWIEARTRVDGNNFIVDINVHFSETTNPGAGVSGTTISAVSGIKASSANTDSPGISQPTAISSSL